MLNSVSIIILFELVKQYYSLDSMVAFDFRAVRAFLNEYIVFPSSQLAGA